MVRLQSPRGCRKLNKGNSTIVNTINKEKTMSHHKNNQPERVHGLVYKVTLRRGCGWLEIRGARVVASRKGGQNVCKKRRKKNRSRYQ